MVHCCVPGCFNDSRNVPDGKKVTFHTFPIVPFLRLSWQQAIGIPMLKIKKSTSVCSEHFNPEDLYENACGIRRVKFGAVPMIMKMVAINEDEDLTELQVCRICLSSETKLYSTQKYNLDHLYELLTGVSVNDTMPQQLCVECTQKIRNFYTLRCKSLKSYNLLLKIGTRNNLLTRKFIKSINRDEIGLASSLKANYFDNYTFEIKYVEKEHNVESTFHPIQNVTLEEEPEIKHEFVNEDEEDLLKNEQSCDEENINDDHDYVPDVNTSDETSQNSSIYIKNEQSDEQTIKETQLLKIEENNTVIDVYHTFVKDEFSSDDNEPLQHKLTKKKLKLDKLDRRRVAKKTRKCLDSSRRARKPRQGPSDKLNNLLFTVTELSFEQQREAVLKRQESTNYKNSPYKCSVCFKGFKDVNAYDRHVTYHSSKMGPFECDVCNTHFSNSHAMYKHKEARHLRRYNCKQCSFVTTNRQATRYHEKWHKGKKYVCPQCSEEFEKCTSYLSHLRIKHRSDYICDLCGYTFVSTKGLDLHKQLKHRLDPKKIPENGPYCELCKVRFACIDAYDRHLDMAAKHNVDDGETSNQPLTEYICPSCGHTFVNRGALGYHRRVRHNDVTELVQSTENGVNCEDCETTFNNQAAFDTHLRTSLRHNGKTTSLSEQKTQRRRRKNVQESNTEPRKKRPKEERKKVEKPAAPVSFYCDQCDLTFKNNLIYYRHMMQVHPDKYAAKRSNLKHMCEICGKQYRSECLLRDHITVHSETKQFKCSLCDKRFHRKYRLQVHFHMIHGNKPKPSLECNVCGKTFTTAFNLQRHQLVHSGLKPFECETCGKCFRQSNERTAHISHVHMKKPWPKRNRKVDRQNAVQQAVVPELGVVPTVWAPRPM